jgi:NCAIR mutase (PurE)-related protein
MKSKDGTVKENRITRKGYPEMVGRLVYMESTMWDMFDDLAKNNKKTRSTFIRCELKDHRYLPKKEGIDWSESNRVKAM